MCDQHAGRLTVLVSANLTLPALGLTASIGQPAVVSANLTLPDIGLVAALTQSITASGVLTLPGLGVSAGLIRPNTLSGSVSLLPLVLAGDLQKIEVLSGTLELPALDIVSAIRVKRRLSVATPYHVFQRVLRVAEVNYAYLPAVRVYGQASYVTFPRFGVRLSALYYGAFPVQQGFLSPYGHYPRAQGSPWKLGAARYACAVVFAAWVPYGQATGVRRGVIANYRQSSAPRRQVEAGYGSAVRARASIRSPYDAVSVVKKVFGAPYQSMSRARVGSAARYAARSVARAFFALPYALRTGEFVNKQVLVSYVCSDKVRATLAVAGRYDMHPELDVVVIPGDAPVLVHGGRLLAADPLEIMLAADLPYAEAQATMLCAPPAVGDWVTVGPWQMRVADADIGQVFEEEDAWRVTLRSPVAFSVGSAPYEGMASAAVAALSGLPVSWHCHDWRIDAPDMALLKGLAPVDAIAAIARAGGIVIQSSPDGALLARRRAKTVSVEAVAIEAEIDTLQPEHRGAEALYASPTASITPDVAARLATIALTPWRPVVVQVNGVPQHATVETLRSEEVIEVVGGIGSVRLPVDQIDSAEWVSGEPVSVSHRGTSVWVGHPVNGALIVRYQARVLRASLPAQYRADHITITETKD